MARIESSKRRYARRTSQRFKAWLVQKKRKARQAGEAICRYFFTFNGDGEITTQRRWNPDALDASFVLEFYNDTSVTAGGVIFSQKDKVSVVQQELGLRSTGAGALILTMGGTFDNILGGALTKLALWRIEFNHAAQTVHVYEDNVLVSTTPIVTIGAERNPSAPIFIGSGGGGEYDIGVLANVKFWVNGSTKETGDLVLDMPINDGSNTIKDYSTISQDGTLTAGTGSWNEVCEGDEDWVDSLAWNDSNSWFD